eukprot:1290604-Ditylum_brightwellii.AAC.1
MEDTNGCSKQYRSASSLYLSSTTSMTYGIVIDYAVCAPEYGKDVVDGLNTVDKRYLRTAMLRNSIPKEDKNVKTMSCHSVTPMRSASFAAECKCLLQHHGNHVSNILASKSSKRKIARKY